MSNVLYRVIQTVKGRIIPTILNKTSNYTVKADQLLYGAVLSNSGASGAVTFTLPAAQPGMKLTASVVAHQSLILDLPTGDIIVNTATSGQTYSDDTVGAYLQLVCVLPNAWNVVARGGGWTAA